MKKREDRVKKDWYKCIVVYSSVNFIIIMIRYHKHKRKEAHEIPSDTCPFN